jgi:hypothetical protein
MMRMTEATKDHEAEASWGRMASCMDGRSNNREVHRERSGGKGWFRGETSQGRTRRCDNQDKMKSKAFKGCQFFEIQDVQSSKEPNGKCDKQVQESDAIIITPNAEMMPNQSNDVELLENQP